MSEEGFGSNARVISAGPHRAVLTVNDDGSLEIDLREDVDPRLVDDPAAWRRLLADLAPGLAIVPLPTGSPAITLAEAALRVRWSAPAGTTLRYGPATLVVERAVDLLIELADTSQLLMIGDSAVAASSHLSWLEPGREFLEVYPADTGTFLSANGRFQAPGTEDAPATLLEFDPLGNDVPQFLVDAELETVASNTDAKLPILRNAAPFQQLVATSVGPGLDGAVATRLQIDVGRLVPSPTLTNHSLLDARHLALTVDHGAGFPLLASPEGVAFSYPVDPGASEGPLRWSFERDDGAADEPLFVLATDNADHRLVLAKGVTARLMYHGVSRDPIRFIVERFEITRKGVTADARVADDPVRLNGVDTSFRFTDGLIQIRDGVIADFTLRGSGPLPPALVGQGTADVSIRFSDTAGGVAPVDAGAALTEDRPLFSPDVLFEYAVDALGLQFVEEAEAFHFYFTMSGNATFSPGPDYPSTNLLAQLDVATVGLIDAPLAGDASVLARHISFTVELAEPASFAVLGCFDMQIQAVGFHPSYYPFDGDAGLELAGQVKFADGEGDKALGVESRHKLVIGAPAPGTFVPRVHFVELAIVVEKGDAFKLDVVVNFYDDEDRAGFDGEGTLEIKGLPGLAVAVGFMRVRRPVDDKWLRAWFIAANVSKLTLRVPVLEFYLREIGLGFGYRYTLASIAAADETDDVGDLLERLRELSRSQGDLATRDAWAVSLEEPEADPRWTIALRALFSQSASPSSTPIRWNEAAEKNVPSAFLFDVVASIRSDLVFFIAARAWINTNYYDYVMDVDEAIRSKPLFTGFALLEPRKQRFLAQIASNPEGYLGSRPPLPDFIQAALRNGQFAATVLIEPNLFHAELGWPNQLRWGMDFGPLRAQVRAGLIYRIAQRGSTTDLVIGISYLARASMRFSAGVSVGVAGVDLIATADGSFGARLIAAAQLGSGRSAMQIYGAVGVDIRIRIELRVWIEFLFITKTWTFALEMQFTASLEFGVIVDGATTAGIRGRGTLRIRVLGRSFEVRARIESGGSRVDSARSATERYLSIGLEADEEATRAIPGTRPAQAAAGNGRRRVETAVAAMPAEATTEAPVKEPEPQLSAARYDVFVVRPANPGDPAFALLYPSGDEGFVPVPPADSSMGDFRLDVPEGVTSLERWEPQSSDFVVAGTGSHEWSADWVTKIASRDEVENPPEDARDVTLGVYLEPAFVEGGDPPPLVVDASLSDGRVKAPSEAAYESAVRGAFEQFRNSPLFKPDPDSTYERALSNALNPKTTIYPEQTDDDGLAGPIEGARQYRGMVVHNMVDDVRAYAAGDNSVVGTSPAFLLGLVLRVDAGSDWLAGEGGDHVPALGQRVGPATASEPQPLRVFNRVRDDFAQRPPRLEDMRTFTDATTVAFSWDLVWDGEPSESDERDEPEHHLAHYQVTRRALDDGMDQMTTTVKPADVLEAGTADDPFSVRALRPRFQFVDHFGHETDAEIAALPASGKSYIYTITPVDLNGSQGRGVSVIATRYPNEPPAVPVDTDLAVTYQITAGSFEAVESARPPAFEPDRIRISWTRPTIPVGAPIVAIGEHRLVFRRMETMAIGSYGIDAATTGDLPSSNARVRPDDIVMEIEPGEPDRMGRHETELMLDDLRTAGVFPAEAWLAEGWRVFIQTVSAAEVPSALVPVKVLLRFEGDGHSEERHPSHLEWITRPLDFPAVTPQDGSARPMLVHVPQPRAGDGDLDAAYGPHPAGRRAVRVRWNQAPSSPGETRYPTALSGGFQVFRLDVDAQGPATFADAAGLTAALERIDEVRLQPPDEMGLVPSTTLTPAEWEAWYPDQSATRDWSGHRLRWPVRHDESLRGRASSVPEFIHPLLRHIVAAIDERYIVNLQAGRPLNAGTLEELMSVTAPAADPYGWALLQHLGLSVALSLRDTQTGQVVTGDRLRNVVAAAVEQARAAPAVSEEEEAVVDHGAAPHLVTELLFKSDAAVGAAPAPAAPEQLLALIQLSLRPLVVAIPPEATEADRARLIQSEREGLAQNAEHLQLAEELRRIALDEPAQVETWLHRFVVTASPEQAQSPPIATAYPRPSAPAIASPDPSGRVTYHDLITDGWAHAYRYYLQPYSRYDRLWASLAGAPGFAHLAEGSSVRRPTDPPAVDPEAGGIDAVLERTAPLAAPVIISSTRIDTKAESPATTTSPGRTWEVALAQHPEQVLSERNRTLSRLLDYRQIAFTILRRFVADVEALSSVQINPDDIALPGPVRQELPESVGLDHIDLNALTDHDRATLALPERIGGFGAGALAVQIDHLPFYYEHALIAVAQTSELASAPVSTIHREFGYRSPAAAGSMSVVSDPEMGPQRHIAVPLARFWDALTEEQQGLWPAEEPESAVRRPGAVPDPDVSYEILLAVNGTVSMVARVYFDRPDGVESAGPGWRVAPAGEDFPVRQAGAILASADLAARDRSVVVEIGPSGIQPHPPSLVWVSASTVVPDAAGAALDVAPRDAWNVALYGRDSIDLSGVVVVPALAPALARVASMAEKEEVVTTTFDPTRPLPPIDALMGDIDDVSYVAFEWTLPPDDESVARFGEALSGGVMPERISEPLVRLHERLRAMQEPIVEEVGVSFEELFPDDTLQRPEDNLVVWTGEPSLMREIDSIITRLPSLGLDAAEAAGQLIDQLQRLPDAFVELWGRDTLAADLGGDDAESLLDAFAGAPPEVFDVAERLISDADLRARLREVMAEHPGKRITVAHDGVRPRPSPDQVAGATDNRLRLAGGVLTWQGFANEHHLEMLRGLNGDPDFLRGVHQVADRIESEHLPPLRVETGAAVPVTAGLEGTDAEHRLVVSPFVWRQDRFLDLADATAAARVAAPADRAAIELQFRQALLHDLGSGTFQIRARRAGAEPSSRLPIEIPSVSGGGASNG